MRPANRIVRYSIASGNGGQRLRIAYRSREYFGHYGGPLRPISERRLTGVNGRGGAQTMSENQSERTRRTNTELDQGNSSAVSHDRRVRRDRCLEQSGGVIADLGATPRGPGTPLYRVPGVDMPARGPTRPVRS